MAVLDGGVSFDARRESGIPRTLPYTKAAANANLLKKGVPLVKSSTTTDVDLPAVTAGKSQADKLIGFAVTSDRASSAADLNSAFAQFPGENQPGSGGLEQVLVHVADTQTEFQLALDPAQTPTIAMIGTAMGLKKQSNGQWTLDSTYTTHAPCLITKIDPDQFVLGGAMTFRIPSANSQYLSGN